MAQASAPGRMATPIVLLTRPRREARTAARALAAAGFAAIRMPLQATRRAPRSMALDTDLGWAAAATIQVFVSRAAVAAAHALARPALARATTRVAVGRATAAALNALGLTALAAPSDAEDSSGVLGLDELQRVSGKRIAIWAAPGGRELIAQTLSARGAEVRAIAVYRRLPVRPAVAAVRALRRSSAVVLSATSAALLRELDRLLVQQRLTGLRARPLIVASARIAELATTLGFADVHIAAGASPVALIAAVRALIASGRA